MCHGTCGGQRTVVESVLSFHLDMAPEDQTQVARLVWLAPLPDEPSCQPSIWQCNHFIIKDTVSIFHHTAVYWKNAMVEAGYGSTYLIVLALEKLRQED